MGRTLNLGRRVELTPMDPHCHDITIGLYQQHATDGAQYVVHTYSGLPDARDRIAFIHRAMQVMGGLEPVHGEPGALRFNCGSDHLKACRRLFIDACKLTSDSDPQARPLTIEDKKSGQTVRATYAGNGTYRLSAETPEAQAQRVPVYVNGLVKLAELQTSEDQPDSVQFECHTAHDPIVGQLLVRAQNVRAILREQEMQASRGVLSAPSARQEA